VRYIQTPHVSNVLAQSQVAVDVLAIQRVRCVAATQTVTLRRHDMGFVGGGGEQNGKTVVCEGGGGGGQGCRTRWTDTAPSVRTLLRLPRSTTHWCVRSRHTCKQLPQHSMIKRCCEDCRLAAEDDLWPVLSKP
jgi:hypothetical protein